MFFYKKNFVDSTVERDRIHSGLQSNVQLFLSTTQTERVIDILRGNIYDSLRMDLHRDDHRILRIFLAVQRFFTSVDKFCEEFTDNWKLSLCWTFSGKFIKTKILSTFSKFSYFQAFFYVDG